MLPVIGDIGNQTELLIQLLQFPAFQVYLGIEDISCMISLLRKLNIS